MSERLEGTPYSAQAIARVKYSHDEMINFIILNPTASQQEVAKQFDYSVAWVSRIMNSDAFHARLAIRKEDLIDPAIVATLEERVRGMVGQSLDILTQKLEQVPTTEMAFRAFELGSKALGFGARPEKVAVQNNFIVKIPSKAADAGQWAEVHGPAGFAGPLIEGGK